MAAGANPTQDFGQYNLAARTNGIRLNANEPLVVATGGTVTLPATTTIGGSSVSALGTITSSSATAFDVGLNGATNPAFNVDSSTGSQAAGLNVIGATAAGTVAVAVISSGGNANLSIDAKGSGTVTINGTGTGNIIPGAPVVFAANKGVTVTAGTSAFDFSGGSGIFKTSTGAVTIGPGAITVSGAITSSSSIVSSAGTGGGIGYATGAGGAVTQATNRTTGVTLSKLTGTITTSSASLAAATSAAFTVTNTTVAVGDVVVVSQQSGSNGGNTGVFITTVAAGSFQIMVSNMNAGGGTAETGAILINYAVIKAVSA